jgi:hypothetical protein
MVPVRHSVTGLELNSLMCGTYGLPVSSRFVIRTGLRALTVTRDLIVNALPDRVTDSKLVLCIRQCLTAQFIQQFMSVIGKGRVALRAIHEVFLRCTVYCAPLRKILPRLLFFLLEFERG